MMLSAQLIADIATLRATVALRPWGAVSRCQRAEW